MTNTTPPERSQRSRRRSVWMLPLLLAFGLAHAAPDDRAMAPSGEQAQALYWRGHEALKRGEFGPAGARFAELERDLRRREPSAVDAAIYWQAYAQAQERRMGEARASVERLLREFPASRWRADAEALLESARNDTAELNEAALMGLMSAPAERALPLLDAVLRGEHDARTQQRALFVLSQIDDPRAAGRLLDVARSGAPPLRRRAIELLGMGGNPEALAALHQLYADTDDPEQRRAVLRAWMIAGERQALAASAREEPRPELAREAVRLLGAIGARAELAKLLAEHSDAGVREATLEALGIAGGVQELSAFAAADGNPTLRAAALRALGIAGARDELSALYPRMDTPELRRAALGGLLISGDGAALRRLYGQAQSHDEKRQILRLLGAMGETGLAAEVLGVADSQGDGRETTAVEHRARPDPQRYIAHAGTAVDRVDLSSIERHERLGELQLAVFVKGGDAWLLELEPPCARPGGEQASSAERVLPSNTPVRAGIDAIRLNGVECVVQRIRPLDPRATRMQP